MNDVKRVALLTAGGLAPCLSSAVGGLIERYTEIAPDIDIIAYIGGYKGLLKGEYIRITDEVRENARFLHNHGGSPIGNSRVKLTNVADCIKRGLVKDGNPLEVAAKQLSKDGVDVLHTVGGDDTNTTAADLAAYLAGNGYNLTVVGLPKTIDNDVYPIKQSLGAFTAAEQSAVYFRNVVSEHSANPRMLIIHEVMGRNCGWLTAMTAKEYRNMIKMENFVPEIGLSQKKIDVHAVFIPENAIDIEAEAARLKHIMDEIDCVNIFISEGAGVDAIVKQMEENGQEIIRDAFGHIKLDTVNPGKWFGEQFAKMLGAEKVLIQKSGYYARATAANARDLSLIKSCTDLAVDCALKRQGGVIGHDEEDKNILKAIDFKRIAGGKPFDSNVSWYRDMLKEIGQLG